MEPNKITADEALNRLKEGNERFVNGNMDHPNLNADRRKELTGGQAPFAVVLACADSRVSPDLVFDQGLGDLFVIRVAGNVAREKVLGSIEYAIQHLGTKLVMVLGHEKCGAVAAALEPSQNEGNIDRLLDIIRPAVHIARHQDGELLENSVKNNAKMVKEYISDAMPVMSNAVKNEGVKIASGYYKLESGKVEMLD
jgi:carbonic anhydrase